MCAAMNHRAIHIVLIMTSSLRLVTENLIRQTGSDQCAVEAADQLASRISARRDSFLLVQRSSRTQAFGMVAQILLASMKQAGVKPRSVERQSLGERCEARRPFRKMRTRKRMRTKRSMEAAATSEARYKPCAF